MGGGSYMNGSWFLYEWEVVLIWMGYGSYMYGRWFLNECKATYWCRFAAQKSQYNFSDMAWSKSEYFSVDNTGYSWCYVNSSHSNSCEDLEYSSRFPGTPWSYQACSTPPLTSIFCREYTSSYTGITGQYKLQLLQTHLQVIFKSSIQQV